MNPYLSVVIPTLNEEKFLPKLLGDLSAQAFRNFEVIVVDATSSDKTLAEAGKFGNRLAALKIIKTRRRNNAFQRNLGAEAAKGKWIIFMDADSGIAKDFFSDLVPKLRHMHADVFTCALEPDGKDASDLAVANLMNVLMKTLNILNYPGAVGAFIGCRKTAFTPETKFDEKVGFAEDGKFIRNMISHGSAFRVLDRPVFVFSMRRFRKNGYMNALLQYIVLNFRQKILREQISSIKDYEMGGQLYD